MSGSNATEATMESLGQILRRIGTTGQSKSDSSGSPSTSRPEENRHGLPNGERLLPLNKPPDCPKCQDEGGTWRSTGFVRGTNRGQDVVWRPCDCRAAQLKAEERQAKLVLAATLPQSVPPRTFANFETSRETIAAWEIAMAYAENPFATPIVTFTGVSGCGKTHLLEAIGRRLLERQVYIRYTVAASLLDLLRASYNLDRRAADNLDDDDKFQDIFDRYDHAHLLILDDLGAEKATPWAMEKLWSLVNNRCLNHRPLAIGTNLDFKTMRDHLGPRTADRIWDTGSGLVTIVSITAGSYRTGGRK